MTKKLSIILLVVILAACSARQHDAKMESSRGDYAGTNDNAESSIAADYDAAEEQARESKKVEMQQEDRMIIHRARLEVNVVDLEKTQQKIEKKVKDLGGYIVESNVYREDDTAKNANLIVRIPEEHFQQFLTAAEGEVADVLNRSVTGQDVTEQYIDLDSRLKSKLVVEERLLEFMEKATKTEDLLKISSDLSKVQEEIEVLKGQMKYIDNQVSFSTVNINMYESAVIIPDIDKSKLNTWDKTKKQFADSMNFLLTASSAMVVFLIGNIPVFLALILIGGLIYFIVRRGRRRE